MNLNLFKLCSVLSILLGSLSWKQKLQAEEFFTKFVYFSDHESGAIGVCTVISDKFKNCQELSNDASDFKYTTNIAAYNNFLYVTDDYHNAIKVFKIDRKDGSLEKLQVVDVFKLPSGIEFRDNKILITNYNIAYNGLSIISLNQDGKLPNILPTYSSYKYNPGIPGLHSYNFNIPGLYYSYGIKFYSKNSKTVAYFSNYSTGIGIRNFSLSLNSEWNKAIMLCNVEDHFSETKGYFKNCYYGSQYENNKFFYYPEKIFINNDIFYTTNYNNEKFTYSRINNDFIIESPNTIQFEDNFKVNYVDFHNGYSYLASAGHQIKKCKLQPDGGILPYCNTKLNFLNTPLANKTFDIVKFVDVK